MKRLLAVLLCMAACSQDQEAATAYLSAVQAIGPEGNATDILNPPDAALGLHSPLSSLRTTFTALLDPKKVQDLSGQSPQPGRGVAKIIWQRAAGTVELPLAAVYNPARTALGAPAPTVTFTAEPALPAGAVLTLLLEPTRLVNKSAEPYVGPRQVSLETAPFGVAVPTRVETVGPDFTPRLIFNSVPASFSADAVTVLGPSGAVVPIEVIRERTSSLQWVISPVGEAVPWPAGKHVLRLDSTKVTDTYGVPLSGDVGPWSFTVVDGRDGAAD